MTSHYHDDENRTESGPKSTSDQRGDPAGAEAERGSQEHGHGHPRRHRHRHGGRKERVLHTRISEQLSDDIRRLAEDLRVPTSNLVRNVLEEVFTMVESVSEDVGGIFDNVLDEAESARDRVRRQAERTRRSRHRRRHRRGERSRDGGERFEEAVENELRSDEAREFSPPPNRPEESARAEAEPERRERPEFPDVLGWQPLVLNRDQSCASCGVDLPRGVSAFVGLGEQGLLRTTLCRACTGIR